jgi:hypothetical protein
VPGSETDKAQSRFRKVALTAVVGCVLAIVLVALVGVSLGVDIGGNDELFNVGVRNNSSESVLLEACTAYCRPFGVSWYLRPGQSASTGQDPDGAFRPMELLSQRKILLGCLPFRFSKDPPSGTVIDVSQMVPCGKQVGAAAAGERDWPFLRY